MTEKKKTATIHEALLKAQQEMSNPKLTGVNPHFHSKFAPLDAVLEACKKPLNDNGLILLQPPVKSEGGVGVKTLIIHESGKTLDLGELHIPVAQSDAQKYVAALTYARRASASSALGLVGEEDTDGHGLGDKGKEAPKKEVSAVDKAFIATCKEAAKVLEKDTCAQIVEKCNFKSTKDIKLDKDKVNVTEQLKAAIALAGLGK